MMTHTDPESAASSLRLSVPALMGWAHQLFEAEYYQSSADLFRYVLSRAPDELSAWYLLARCHQALGDHETAAQLLEIASTVGRASEFLQLAANSWQDAGDNLRASEALQTAWELAE